jgi:hypothetical protein
MNIYKLKYTNKESAIVDLISKGIYAETEEGLIYSNGTQAVVEIGLIILTDGTYDENLLELTSPIFAEGYHYDVMTTETIVFENEIICNNPRHNFAGYNNIINE